MQNRFSVQDLRLLCCLLSLILLLRVLCGRRATTFCFVYFVGTRQYSYDDEYKQHLSYHIRDLQRTTTMSTCSRFMKYMTIGSGEMHWTLWMPMYFAPLVWLLPEMSAYVYGETTEQVLRPRTVCFLLNAVVQAVLFMVVCQIPCYVTGHMAYVDIAWPGGLTLMALVIYYVSGATEVGGNALRTSVVCLCLFLHGARMFLGALFLFGKMTKGTYRFKEDLPRYRYAKLRWAKKENMPIQGWWLKVQHDTLQQCFANVAILSAPMCLMCFSESETIHPLEIAGLAMWIVAWVLENVADAQKMAFVSDIRKSLRGTNNESKRSELKLACLGYGPYAISKYWLWTKSRHPNYFFEWIGWMGFTVASIPSLATLSSDCERVGFGLLLFAVVRFFYDCLVHWTGAGPAEHFSAAKRPHYIAYQKKTRCFFPFEMPFVDHYRRPKWSSL